MFFLFLLKLFHRPSYITLLKADVNFLFMHTVLDNKADSDCFPYDF